MQVDELHHHSAACCCAAQLSNRAWGRRVHAYQISQPMTKGCPGLMVGAADPTMGLVASMQLTIEGARSGSNRDAGAKIFTAKTAARSQAPKGWAPPETVPSSPGRKHHSAAAPTKAAKPRSDAATSATISNSSSRPIRRSAVMRKAPPFWRDAAVFRASCSAAASAGLHAHESHLYILVSPVIQQLAGRATRPLQWSSGASRQSPGRWWYPSTACP